jgi:hypothetical protein
MSRHLRDNAILNVLVAAGSILCLAAIDVQNPEFGGAGRRESFTPVAPPAALHGAMKANMKILQGWLDNGDFTSAAETTEGLILLANIYGCHSDEPSWKEKAAGLKAAFQLLMTRAREKDAAGCEKASQACATLLEELADSQPKGGKGAGGTRPAGTFRTIMKLMDGSYADAKGTKSASERADFLYTIAECANLTWHMRNDTDWHQRSDEMRDEAMRLAEAKPSADLQEVRRELKNVYQRCEACHQAYKK